MREICIDGKVSWAVRAYCAGRRGAADGDAEAAIGSVFLGRPPLDRVGRVSRQIGRGLARHPRRQGALETTLTDGGQGRCASTERSSR